MSSPCSFVAIHLSTADRPRRQERWLTTGSAGIGQINPLQASIRVAQLVFLDTRFANSATLFSRSAMPETAAFSLRRASVLLLEAEPMLRQTMTKFLQRSGYHVTACSDAAAAETMLVQRAVRPSLIVL